MPAAKVFADANVLLYIHDRGDAAKAESALLWVRELAKRRMLCTNLQVLNEVTHVLLRKKWFESPAQAYDFIDEFSVLGRSPIGWREVARAREIHIQTSYSWWDSLLLASALELGCSHFLSEDLQDGQAIDGLTIVDPFAHSPEEILAS